MQQTCCARTASADRHRPEPNRTRFTRRQTLPEGGRHCRVDPRAGAMPGCAVGSGGRVRCLGRGRFRGFRIAAGSVWGDAAIRRGMTSDVHRRTRARARAPAPASRRSRRLPPPPYEAMCARARPPLHAGAHAGSPHRPTRQCARARQPAPIILRKVARAASSANQRVARPGSANHHVDRACVADRGRSWRLAEWSLWRLADWSLWRLADRSLRSFVVTLALPERSR
jgi:hypothetical protein